MNWQKHITTDPKIMFGKPVVKNTRIPVDLILEKLACGESIPQLLKAYPNLSEQSIQACLHFAADSVRNDIVYATK